MDPVTLAAISAGVQGVTGLVQSIVGGSQQAKAKRMARNNPRPKYKIQTPILDNQALAESRAGQGLSDATMQAYNTSAERGLTGSLDAVLKGGGSVNNIADLYDNYLGGMGKLAMLNEETQTNNIRALIAQNNDYAGELDKEWQVNVFAPYADKAQAAAKLKDQGTDNMWKGINTMGQAVTNYATSQMYKSEGDNVFPKNTNWREPATVTRVPGSGGGTQPPATGNNAPVVSMTGLNPGEIFQNANRPRNTRGSGVSGLDPIMFNGILYDPVTMQPIN